MSLLVRSGVIVLVVGSSLIVSFDYGLRVPRWLQLNLESPPVASVLMVARR